MTIEVKRLTAMTIAIDERMPSHSEAMVWYKGPVLEKIDSPVDYRSRRRSCAERDLGHAPIMGWRVGRADVQREALSFRSVLRN